MTSIVCYADPACTRLPANAGLGCRTRDCRRSLPDGTSRSFACCNPRPWSCRPCSSTHTKVLRKRLPKARRISKGLIRKWEVGVSASSFSSLGKTLASAGHHTTDARSYQTRNLTHSRRRPGSRPNRRLRQEMVGAARQARCSN